MTYYYCHLDSSGNIESTNLQLYSLQQAANSWNELLKFMADEGEVGDDNFKERLAFILSCLGLSLSQLLGQNCPSPEKDKMDQPGDMLGSLLKRFHTERITRRRLNSTFQDFLAYYNAIRHFGRNKDEKNYRTLDLLTLIELDRFRRMTINIWDVIIAMFRSDKGNELDEIPSITKAIWFRDLGEI